MLERTEKYYVIDVNGTRDTISIDRLKPAHIDQTSTILPNHGSLLPNTPHSHSTLPLSSTPLTTTRSEIDSTRSDTNVTRSGRRVRFPDRLNI